MYYNYYITSNVHPVADLMSSILTPSEISIKFRPFSASTSNTHYTCTHIGYHDNIYHDL